MLKVEAGPGEIIQDSINQENNIISVRYYSFLRNSLRVLGSWHVSLDAHVESMTVFRIYDCYVMSPHP